MQRPTSERQTFIGAYLDADFLRAVDAARGALSRSQFVRDALRAWCAQAGVELPESITAAPDRAGKGGPRGRYPPHREQYSTAEERPPA